MDSFFSRVQGYFTDKFQGRYLAVLLKEARTEAPALACRIWDGPPDDLVQKAKDGLVEFALECKLPRLERYSDVGILVEGTAVAFLEIKADDHRNPANHAQLKDYLAVCKSKKRCFARISKHRLPPIPQRVNLKDLLAAELLLV